MKTRWFFFLLGQTLTLNLAGPLLKLKKGWRNLPLEAQRPCGGLSVLFIPVGQNALTLRPSVGPSFSHRLCPGQLYTTRLSLAAQSIVNKGRPHWKPVGVPKSWLIIRCCSKRP